MADGYRMYAGLHGSNIKTVGPDANIYQYTNLATCIAAAQANDVIIIDQGTYSLTASTNINHNLTMVGRGKVIVNCGDDGLSTQMLNIDKPAAGTAATYIKFENIEFANAHATGNVFQIDNDAGGTGALDITFLGCTIDAGVGGQAIDLDQTTATEHIYLRLIGRNGNTLNDCTFGLALAASYVHIENYDTSAEASYFILDALDVASIYQFKDCIFSSAAITTTGAASILVSAINCVNQTANVQRPLTDADFDHTGGLSITGGAPAGPVKLAVAATGIPEFYNTLELAYAQAVAGDTIYLESGSHTVAATITLNKNITIVGTGRCTVTGAVADRLFMINKPAAGTTATYIEFHNIHLVNTQASGDVIEVDNDAGGTGDQYIKTIDCSFTSNSGLSWDIDQTTATINQYIYIKGNMAADMNIDGLNIDQTLAASSVVVDGYDFGAAVFTLGTNNIANILTLLNCQYESEAMSTGGSASLIFNAQGCSRVSAAALVAPAIEDFDATAGSENIQIGTLDT